jgi:predicted DCC family thiol-disulfide oxidoreductase YuxK
MAELTIFYDGFCPLCVREMDHLRKIDQQQKLRLEDIQQPDFSERYPQIDKAEASSILLSQLPNGTLLKGLDSTHKAWSVVGQGWRTGWMRWPLIRWFADRAYLFFARNRYSISRLLTGQSRCNSCSLDDNGKRHCD